MERSPSCHPAHGRAAGTRPCLPDRQAWWRSQVFWAVSVLAATLGLGTWWPPARPVARALWDYVARAGWAVALGLVLGGLIEHYVPKEYISRWLTGHHRRTVVAAAGLGFLASSCSHGCLALTVELFRKGASVPATITFLLASPWASLSLTLLIISLMGMKGLLIVAMALLVAVVTGMVFQWLDQRGWLNRNPHTVAVAADFSIWRDLKARLRQRRWTVQELAGDVRGIASGAWRLGEMVLFWVVLGFTLSAVLGSAVPPGWWSRWLGPTLLGLLATLGVATALEVCSEGTAPLAVELYRRTGALGNAFGFLMGGVITDFTEIAVLWSVIGRRTVFWLLLVTLPQVLVIGYVLNLVVR